jgi:Ulp1 family protease
VQCINLFLRFLFCAEAEEGLTPKRLFFPTQFYQKLMESWLGFDYQAVSPWSKMFDQNVEQVFVVIHLPFHWITVVVDTKRKILHLYDSLDSPDSEKYMLTIFRYVTNNLLVKGN